ncbi:MAG: VCBS repeat-containing protein, partial [Verrucomicrobia bacterium]|nr:VCBS repeat-containing protein [Verrucomicrobiota bacterium]
MKTNLCSAVCMTLIGATALAAQPAYFTQMTDGPIVNDALDTWLGFWGDYDNDGRLDLHVNGETGNWRVYHNDGGTTFSTVTSGPLGDYSSCSLWGIWCDLDTDGDLDLFGWTSPSGLNAMFWNDGTGGFRRDDSWLRGTDAQSVGAVFSLGDFDGDGFIDAFLGAVERRNAQLHNNGDRTFTVVADSALNILGDNT